MINVFYSSFRGASETSERGIQMQAQCVFLDSGSGAYAPSRNDANWQAQWLTIIR
jgi:hypothetical protein